MENFIYVIGSLRSPRPAIVANELRIEGFEVFDDWGAQGELADEYWKTYEQSRGRTYREALAGKAAQHAFQFDYNHLLMCRAAVLVMPCGKSAHLELGLIKGMGKPAFYLMDGEPEKDRWELMTLIATAISFTTDELIAEMRKRGL